jgi:hypothetical protein
MEEILEEIRILKERVSALESQKISLCYETALKDIHIEDVLKSKDEIYIQMCDYILQYNVIQWIDSKLYISHKGTWVKGNQALKDLFTFVEKKWIGLYLKFIENEELSADEFDKYNTIIYGLNLNKSITKIKQYLNNIYNA